MGREARARGASVAYMGPEERPKPAGRVLFGFPSGTSEMVAFGMSRGRMSTYEAAKPDGVRLLHGNVVAPGLYVDDNRTSLVKRALKEGVDWLFQVDTDIEFQPDLLEQMVELAESRGIQILAASVPIGDTYPSTGFMYGEKPGTWVPLKPEALTSRPGEPVEVEAIATAVCLIHRSVFEAMAKVEGRRWFNRDEYMAEEYPEGHPMEQRDFIVLGEDFAFCRRAKDIGIRIWCVYLPGICHWKLMPLSHDPLKPRRGMEG